MSFYFRICFIKKNNQTSPNKITEVNLFNTSIKLENINPEFIGKTCENDGTEFEIMNKILIKMKIFRTEKLIYSCEFFNEIFIPNIFLQKNHDINYSNNLNTGNEKLFNSDTYHLIINFDISDMPDWIRYYMLVENENISWVIRIHSSELLKFHVDTTKEDKEKYVKENWEREDPGRKDKAIYARKKYLIKKKKLTGENITAEEEEILNTKNSYLIKKEKNLHIESNMKNLFDNLKNTENNNDKNKKIIPTFQDKLNFTSKL